VDSQPFRREQRSVTYIYYFLGVRSIGRLALKYLIDTAALKRPSLWLHIADEKDIGHSIGMLF
jgi:hypothetical protein